jgi:hypothetical protein
VLRPNIQPIRSIKLNDMRIIWTPLTFAGLRTPPFGGRWASFQPCGLKVRNPPESNLRCVAACAMERFERTPRCVFCALEGRAVVGSIGAQATLQPPAPPRRRPTVR